ncbi:MAG TPA: HAD family phosphatase [Chlamydiales bacterium]|nr:HAD family phosphatase [Chlamydiales bacterium]
MFDKSLYDAFLFDFDGLLVDSERLHYKAYMMMFQKKGLFLDWDFDVFCNYAHVDSDYFQKNVYKALPELTQMQISWRDLKKEKQIIYFELLKDETIVPMPGVEFFLNQLAESNKAMCVVTNSPRQDIDYIRNKLPQLDCIKHWITREDYKNPKPAPDGYKLGLSILKGKKAAGFEDSIKGVRALIQASIDPYFIHPSGNVKSLEIQTDKKIHCYESFEQLLGL